MSLPELEFSCGKRKYYTKPRKGFASSNMLIHTKCFSRGFCF
uniref:Uncharacterized protein n=1 Tax=Anguilla anguilla TaxID=7936 RepID=A0A0E9XS06_ANGAN